MLSDQKIRAYLKLTTQVILPLGGHWTKWHNAMLIEVNMTCTNSVWTDLQCIQFIPCLNLFISRDAKKLTNKLQMYRVYSIFLASRTAWKYPGLLQSKKRWPCWVLLKVPDWPGYCLYTPSTGQENVHLWQSLWHQHKTRTGIVFIWCACL